MKFPLRLTLDLWRGGIERRFAPAGASVLRCVAPSEIPPSTEELPSATERMAQLATAFWISGEGIEGDALGHPAMGRAAAQLNAARRNVFIHTDGALLRRRIHEFRPDARLFFAVEFSGSEAVHGKMAHASSRFVRAVEGIRAAKLSGFHVCAHVTARPETGVCETGMLFEFLDRYDVDGYLVTAGRPVSQQGAVSEQERKDLRALIRDGRWERFAALLDASYAAAPKPTAVRPAARIETGLDMPVASGGESSAYEETA